MGKLLSWVVLIALAWLVFHLIAISQRRRERSRNEPAAGGTTSSGAGATGERTIEGEPIVPCAHCGLFVPASDVVRDGDRSYCSVAHRDADRAAERSGNGRAARSRSREE
jgi:uncharacterized protein